ARDHNLLAQFVERVERVEEFLLGALLGSEHLNVVHQQGVHGAKALVESRHAVVAQRTDHLIDELLARDVDHLHLAVVALELPADRLHQMGLPHTYAAVQVQRVVHPRRIGGHRARRGMGELIATADHEAVEGVLRIEDIGGRVEIEMRLQTGGYSTGGGRRRVRDKKHSLKVHGELARGIENLPLILRFEPSLGAAVGYRHNQRLALNVAELGWFQPVVVTFRADAMLQLSQDLFPGVHWLKHTDSNHSTGFQHLWKTPSLARTRGVSV